MLIGTNYTLKSRYMAMCWCVWSREENCPRLVLNFHNHKGLYDSEIKILLVLIPINLNRSIVYVVEQR